MVGQHKSIVPVASVLIIMFLILSGSVLWAGEKEKDYTIGKAIVLHSKVLGEDRVIYISVPRGYDLFQTKYPVLYVLDGDAHFTHVNGTVQSLSENGVIPRMIVVAVPNTDRIRDFTPVKDETLKTSGGGENFLSFLRDELIPYVEQNYRTEPFNILAGHSLCGMYSLYTLLTAADLFDGYIAIAPYLAFNNDLLLDMTDRELDKITSLDKFLYVSVGNEPDETTKVEQFKKILTKKAPTGLEWDVAFLSDETHGSAPLLTIYHGLKFIYPDWGIPKEMIGQGFSALKDHYAKLSQRYGYTIEIPEETINFLGYITLQKDGKKEEAIAIFKKNVEMYPGSANVYDSLGEGYEQAEQYERALENYTTAVDKAKKVNDPNLEVFEEHVKRIQSKMK